MKHNIIYEYAEPWRRTKFLQPGMARLMGRNLPGKLVSTVCNTSLRGKSWIGIGDWNWDWDCAGGDRVGGPSTMVEAEMVPTLKRTRALANYAATLES